MKTFIFYLIILTMLGFAVEGCKKDSKNDGTTGNYLRVDGVDYPVSKGFLVNYGANNSVYHMELVLLSSGLTIHEHQGLPDSASGTGHVITYELSSSTGDKLALGNYIYNKSEVAGTFYFADYFLNWNSTLNPYIDFIEITSGTVDVLNNGAEYELNFSGKDSNNKTISGYYKGPLKYYDGSGKKKSSQPKNSWRQMSGPEF